MSELDILAKAKEYEDKAMEFGNRSAYLLKQSTRMTALLNRMTATKAMATKKRNKIAEEAYCIEQAM